MVKEGKGSYETRSPGAAFWRSRPARAPQGKTNLFADTFAGKSKLLVCVVTLTQSVSRALNPTVVQCMAALAGLCEDSSTSPDLVPARILNRCAGQLAKLVQFLLQRMLEAASWPEAWRVHWVVPIYKKSCFSQPATAKEYTLTGQLSNVVERLLLPLVE